MEGQRKEAPEAGVAVVSPIALGPLEGKTGDHIPAS